MSRFQKYAKLREIAKRSRASLGMINGKTLTISLLLLHISGLHVCFSGERPICYSRDRDASKMQGLYISSNTFLKLLRAYVDFRDPVYFRGEISLALSCALPGASERARARVFVRNSVARASLHLCYEREQVPPYILYVSLAWRRYRKSPETARVIYKLRIFGILSAESRGFP